MTVTAERPIRRLVAPQLPWIAVLVVGAALYAAVLAAVLGTGDVLYVPSLLLLGAAVVPVAFITFVSGLDRGGVLSFSRIAAAAAVGGIVAVVVAGPLEYAAAHQLGSLPAWGIGLIEESAKLAIPAALLLWRRPSPLDGVVLGVAVGSAFAMLETMGYALVALLQQGGNLDAVTHILMIRSVSEPGGHAAWTGLACAALFSIRGSARLWRGWLRFVAVFVGVIWLHATWDTLTASQDHLLIAAGSFVLLMTATWWLHRYRPEHAPDRRHLNRWTLRPALAGPAPERI
ncbi:MAG TPA: PrsW family glutamic-type intramembrane protease [Mycobacteriales bacterium]|nr:PrsW family glutamic-type intramembrane protease [Mycobacteriales bacterium]